MSNKKKIVLAVDGLDFKIAERGIRQGSLPNFSRLANEGFFSKLKPTVPPLTPVVWGSFLTGKSPAEHGVYDFIRRNPKDYSIENIWSEDTQKIFKVTPFWNETSKRKIPTWVFFFPHTFPPEKIFGRMISGMGTPDILGSYGKYTLFTTQKQRKDKKLGGKIVYLKEADPIEAFIEGPTYTDLEEIKTPEVSLIIKKDEKKKGVEILVQKKKISLEEKEITDWVRIKFSLNGEKEISGIVRFFLKKCEPNLELYLTPINFDPQKPFYPISYPNEYLGKVAKKYGLFSTKSSPYDPLALEEDILDEDDFLAFCDRIFTEREKIFLGELESFKQGVFIFYFEILDKIQHLFWRFLDDRNGEYGNVIMDYYKRMDDLIGKTVGILKDDDMLTVLSDHGFGSFDWELNLNSWLREQKYLFLKKKKKIGGEMLADVDWKNTLVYSVGYNSLYFNQKGREGSGVVSDKQLTSLKKELVNKLVGLRNPLTGKKIVKKVYTREELKIDKEDMEAPDLFLGFYEGWRTSQASALGAAPKEVFVKREKKWSGCHLFDPSEVPGVLFSNRKVFEGRKKKIENILKAVLEN